MSTEVADARRLRPRSADIESLEWVKIPRGGTLNVRQQNKPTSVFAGFREQVLPDVISRCTGVMFSCMHGCHVPAFPTERLQTARGADASLHCIGL